MLPPFPLLCTDTSRTGWGAHLLNLVAAGVWSREERDLYVNILKMKVVILALDTILDKVSGESVVLMSENTTVVAYLRRHWDAVSRVMSNLALEVVLWTEIHSVNLMVRYIPGKKYILADQLSHPDQFLPTEWPLLPWVSNAACGGVRLTLY